MDVNEAEPRVAPPEHLHRSRVLIQPDLEAHRAPDGTVIGSRAEQREYCARTGQVEFGGSKDFQDGTSWQHRFDKCHPSKEDFVRTAKRLSENPRKNFLRAIRHKSPERQAQLRHQFGLD